MFKRVQEAMADVSETLRRVFQGVAVREGAVGLHLPPPGGVELGLPAGSRGWEPLAVRAQEGAWRVDARMQTEAMAFAANLCAEEGWTAWEAGATLMPVPLFMAGAAGRMAVPALPRKATAGRWMADRFTVRTRTGREPLGTPGVRSVAPAPPRPVAHRNLAHALARPVPVVGRALAAYPKAAQMRINLQLVKGTGENIRDLEVLGLFRVPRKGVRQIRIDPRSGRLLVSLSEEAVGAAQGMMVMARRRSDQAVLSCFVEP